MAVHKGSAARLSKSGETYVTFPSSTLQLIQNPVALAILAYLLDQSEDWEIWRGHLMTRFALGRDRYDKAMKHLRDLGLCWTEYKRGPGGKILSRHICVSASPRGNTESIAADLAGKRDEEGTDNLNAENVHLGDAVPTDHQNAEIIHLGDDPKPPDLNAENPQLGKTHNEVKPSLKETPQDGKTDHLTKYKLTNYKKLRNHSDADASATDVAKPVDNSFQALGNDYQSPSAEKLIFERGTWFLGQHGIDDQAARSFLGMLKSDVGPGRTLDAILVSLISQPAKDPKGFILGVVANQPKPMEAAWQPEATQVGELEGLGVPMGLIRNARDIFVTWFHEQEISHSNWPRLFKDWVIRDWEAAEFQAHLYRTRLAESAGLNYQRPFQEAP